jgi:phage gpG-like protein
MQYLSQNKMGAKSSELLKSILSDVRVELADEFDRNFERKAFFDRPWDKRSRASSRGTLLAVSGQLRRSVRATVGADSVRFSSAMPYAAIHNDGGKIAVTPRMRKFFWAKYYEHAGRVSKLKSGKASASKRNVALSAEARFYKNMALTKKETIAIPQRQFMGNHPKVRAAVEAIANRRITERLDDISKILKR